MPPEQDRKEDGRADDEPGEGRTERGKPARPEMNPRAQRAAKRQRWGSVASQIEDAGDRANDKNGTAGISAYVMNILQGPPIRGTYKFCWPVSILV